MSRVKSRQNTEVCGDCGAQDPTWASINKGILLCTACCSIHRSLGRHISQVKSLQKNAWNKSQLEMVHALNNSGVNNIWEHFLLESGSKSRKKPTPKDPLSAKADFIRAKHQQCAFVFLPSQDGMLCVENELGKQLHASVRTSNLETSFRFLINGADPNYFHDEKGSTPLHVAARSNQKLQAELLIVYGADPTFPDAQGLTPIDYARKNADKELANRLVEVQYEVTDKFIHYLTNRKPDHTKGVHFIMPQTGYKSDSKALNKLRKLSNNLFEELVMDVYDEVDRRETEAIWLSSADTIDLSAVPFLPVDPALSTTRNQGRQKLARFSTPELNSLVYDMLVETQRRHTNYQKGDMPLIRAFSQISDDDPLYDSVASDEDYATVPLTEKAETTATHKELSPTRTSDTNTASCADSATSERLELLTRRLEDSNTTIATLKAEVSKLRTVAETLKHENTELKTRLSHSKTDNQLMDHNFNARLVNGDGGMLDGLLLNRGEDPKIHHTNGHVSDFVVASDLRAGRKCQRPSSMYETREGLRTPNWQTIKNQIKASEQTRNATHSLYASSPQYQHIMHCAEQVTKCIQQLCQCLGSTAGREECVHCADKIRYAVTNLSAYLEQDSDGDLVKSLLESVRKLQIECTSIQEVNKKREASQVDHYIVKIKECAYNIAKDTKQIITKYATH